MYHADFFYKVLSIQSQEIKVFFKNKIISVGWPWTKYELPGPEYSYYLFASMAVIEQCPKQIGSLFTVITGIYNCTFVSLLDFFRVIMVCNAFMISLITVMRWKVHLYNGWNWNATKPFLILPRFMSKFTVNLFVIVTYDCRCIRVTV